MTATTFDYEDYRLRMAVAAADQLLAHLADPLHEPMYVPADADGLETEAYTAAGPEEPN